MPKKPPKPREPRAPTAGYIRRTRRIWHTTQGLIAYGLWPLLEVWEDSLRSDQKRSRRGGTGVESAYPATPERARAYNPLAPRPLLPRIWNLSDAELRRLWPGLDPRDIRDFAPWSVSRDEVRRIMGQGPLTEMREVEAFVRASIETARLAQPPGAPPQIDIIPPRRPPGAFRLRPREYAPVVLDAAGIPIAGPPIVNVVNEVTIARQLEWIDLATSRMLTVENIGDEVAQSGRQLDLFNRRDMERVLGIDVREIPEVDMYIDQWRDLNVNLIETGLRAQDQVPQLRGVAAPVPEPPKGPLFPSGWDKISETEYTAETRIGHVRLQKRGKHWFADIPGQESVQLPRRAQFGHAEGLVERAAQRIEAPTVRPAVRQPPKGPLFPSGWDKISETEYVAETRIGRVRVQKRGSHWFADIPGQESRRLPRKAQFGHAEGLVEEAAKKMEALLPKEAPRPAPRAPRRTPPGVRLRKGSLLQEVSETIRRAHAEGVRVEVLAHDLRERFDVSDSRAELIARDQTLKLNAQISRHRQLSAGVEEYIWDTSGDERVRESHAVLDGRKFSWHTPPSVGHPGQDYQCRCTAIPVIPE